MRIISKFHDYYDTAMGYGADASLIYRRDTKYIYKGYKYPYNAFQYVLNAHVGTSYGFSASRRIVGFCGNIYPVLHVQFKPVYNETYSEFCYTLEDVDAIVKNHFPQKYQDAYFLTKKSKNRGLERLWDHWARRDRIAEFFALDEASEWDDLAVMANLPNLFREYRTPIFVIKWLNPRDGGDEPIPEGNYIVMNTCLKNIHFYKKFNAFEAFQEISMYLGGILGTGNPSIPHVSDEDLSAAKGFDKYSFRKDKSK